MTKSDAQNSGDSSKHSRLKRIAAHRDFLKINPP